MKNIVKLFGFAAIGLFAATSTSAQPDYGSDPTTCQRNLSLYRSDYDHKNYDAAIINWRKVWADCPQSSPNLLLHGTNMYKAFIAKELDQNKKKALVILNSIHGYKQDPPWLPLPTRPLIRRAGEFINKAYPDKSFHVYINFCNIDNYKLSNDGIIDAAFEYTKKTDVGFDLKGTPVGNAKFDLYYTYAFAAGNYDANINYNYIFDGMIFYKPLREMVIKVGIPNIYSKEYEDVFLKRVALIFEKTLENDKEFIDSALKEVNNPVEIPIDKFIDVKSWDEQIRKWIE
jgi:hypothetical protein